MCLVFNSKNIFQTLKKSTKYWKDYCTTFWYLLYLEEQLILKGEGDFVHYWDHFCFFVFLIFSESLTDRAVLRLSNISRVICLKWRYDEWKSKESPDKMHNPACTNVSVEWEAVSVQIFIIQTLRIHTHYVITGHLSHRQAESLTSLLILLDLVITEAQFSDIAITTNVSKHLYGLIDHTQEILSLYFWLIEGIKSIMPVISIIWMDDLSKNRIKYFYLFIFPQLVWYFVYLN